MDFREQLVDRVQRDIMACIGCNDCMLACPLPETRGVSIAELNYAVQQDVIQSQNVIDFVTACTQCRQCVPVCPADLSRADIVLFNKLKVEDAVQDQRLLIQVGEQVTDSGWTLDGLAQHLTGLPIFGGVSARDLRRLLMKSTLRHLAPGGVLCREGTYHERLFIILSGSVEQTVANETGSETRILVMGAGSFHGEMAVMANQKEIYTVTALAPAAVLEIPKTTFYQLMSLSEVFKERMESLYGQRALWSHARQSPVLAPLPEESLRHILNEATLEIISSGEQISIEGGPSEDLFLVRSGFLRVSKRFGNYGERVLLYFREGDNFGALPLLSGTRRSAFTVQASTRAELIRIPGSAFLSVLQKNLRLREYILAEALEAERTVRSPDLGPVQTGSSRQMQSNTTHMGLGWTGLLDQGVLQGHELLVIDQNLCTDCNNCVDACGRRHGRSRLERSGLQLDNLLFPTACRHCEDPVCLMCSVNGIVRLPNGEITIVEDNCIGCGACAQRCPYGNIRMHPLEMQKESFLRRMMDFAFWRKRQPEHEIPLRTEAKVAVKCDLCAGFPDYACVTACPVGAAFRVDPVRAFGGRETLIGLEMKSK